MPKVNPNPSRKAINSRRFRERKLAASGGRQRKPGYETSMYAVKEDDPDEEGGIARAPGERKWMKCRPGPGRGGAAVADDLGEIPMVGLEELEAGGGSGDDGHFWSEEEEEVSWREESDDESWDESGEELPAGGSDSSSSSEEGDGGPESGTPEGEDDEDDDLGGEDDFLGMVRRRRPPCTRYNEDELVRGSNSALFEQIAAFLLYVHAKYSLSLKGCEEVFRYFLGCAEGIVRTKRDGEAPLSAHNLIRRARGSLPPIYTKLTVDDPEGGAEVTHGPVPVVKKRLTRGKVVVREDVSMRLEQIVEMVYDVHGVGKDGAEVGQEWLEVVMSSDDVSECKSAPTKLKFICISFPKCGRAVPWMIIRTEKPGTKVSLSSFLPALLTELQSAGLQLKMYLADKKERNYVKGMISSNGYYSCDQCEVRGSRKEMHPLSKRKKGEKRKAAKAIYWARAEGRGRLRDNDRMRRQAAKWKRKLAGNGGRPPAGRKGWKGMVEESPLLEVEGFDLYRMSPPDPLHLLDIGLVKKLYCSTFINYHAAQLKRPRGGERSRRAAAVVDALDSTSNGWKSSKAEELDVALSKLRLPSAFQRRLRPVRSAHFKAAEWRQLCLLMGPYIARTVLADSPPHRAVWALMSYIYRILAGPAEIFARAYHSRGLTLAMEELHKLYEELFGAETMTSNEHCYFSHLVDFVRDLGPTGSFSTEPYESLYGVSKCCFWPGTPGTLKQILTNNAIRFRTAHRCVEDAPLAPRAVATERSDDTRFFWRGGYYAVAGATKGASWVTANPIRTERLELAGGSVDLDWTLCGVRRVVGVDRGRRVGVEVGQIECRAMQVEDLILSVRNEWIRY